jgi:hypothetical protein
MTVYSGVGTQVAFGLEVTAGTPVTTGTFLPLLGDKLGSDRPRIEADSIRAGRRFQDSNDWAGGNVSPGGDLQFELRQKDIGKLLTGMFGTVTSTTGPVSSLYTHTWTSAGEPLPMTIQKGVPDVNGVVDPLTYTGCLVDEWELACNVGEFVSLGITVAAMREFGVRTVADGVTTSGSAAITSATASFVSDDDPVGPVRHRCDPLGERVGVGHRHHVHDRSRARLGVVLVGPEAVRLPHGLDQSGQLGGECDEDEARHETQPGHRPVLHRVPLPQGAP